MWGTNNQQNQEKYYPVEKEKVFAALSEVVKKGFKVKEVSLIFDCGDMLNQGLQSDSASLEALLNKTNNKSRIKESLEERFLQKAFLRLSSKKGTENKFLID